MTDLPSGNEYLAVAVSKTAGVAWPEGYTKDPEGKTVDAKISNTMNMTLLQKDGETFYWGPDKIEYPPEGGVGTSWYSVYKGLTDKMEIVDHWGDKKEAVIAAPVEGMRNLTADQEGYPEGYKTVIEKNGMYSYYCTNDVIKVSPSGLLPIRALILEQNLVRILAQRSDCFRNRRFHLPDRRCARGCGAFLLTPSRRKACWEAVRTERRTAGPAVHLRHQR